MICLKARYFDLNRNLLLAIGLWPYQQSKFTRLQNIFLCSIMMTAIIFQFTTFITLKCTPDLVIKILSNALFFPTFIIVYNGFYFKIEDVKNLLGQLQYICEQIKNENEIAIIEKYGCYAKRYTIILTILAICSIFFLFIVQLSPTILDITLPVNISRPRRLTLITEYFVDQEKYFYLILLHINATYGIGVMTIVATGTMFFVCLQHTCGMFAIASYRIEHAMEINLLQNINLKKKNLIFKGIICAVDIHRQAMKLSTNFVSTIEAIVICLIILGVISLSLNLFRVFQITSSASDVKELLLPLLFITAPVLYMFIANNVGQDLTDHSNYIFTTVYNVRWYIAPLHIQKLILFLLQRGTKDFTVNIGGLFASSVKSFATMINTSISYFTLLYSVQ